VASSRSLLRESLLIFKEVGERGRVAAVLGSQGLISLREGNYVAACALLEESLRILLDLDYKWDTINCLEYLAVVLVAQGELERAIWCLSASQALREAIGTPLSPALQTTHEFTSSSLRTQLGEQVFDAAWAEGQTMPPEYILSSLEPRPKPALTTPSSASVASLPPLHAGLTPRELEVLRLLAQGLTSAQIAEHLTLSVLTVNTHVRSIYSKLGVTSRSAATRWAIEHHLV
jgi:DNA-binding CsgD family transcriptional regulator